MRCHCFNKSLHELWSIILAGKEDHSTHPRLQRWLRGRKPKPFCTFVGSRSMLQHTWDRADQISHPHCKITVVGKPYLHETCSQLGGRAPGAILTEPKNYGMIPSLFLALTYLQTKDPDATVIAYPSDHFIYPDAQFLGTIQRAVWASERLTDHVILVGSRSASLESRKRFHSAGSATWVGFHFPIFME